MSEELEAMPALKLDNHENLVSAEEFGMQSYGKRFSLNSSARQKFEHFDEERKQIERQEMEKNGDAS